MHSSADSPRRVGSFNPSVPSALRHVAGSLATASGKRTAVVLLLLSALWFGFLELRGLYFPDEGRYAEIPREMLATGDWVTPRLNGIPYFEKPPLQYWATAVVFAVAGEDEWTARLAPAVAGFLAVLAVWATAARLFSRRAGWMAAAVLASSVGYFLANQFLTLDVTLAALLTGALCSFLLAQRNETGDLHRGRWMWLAWLLSALAFLTKGAIALVIPGLTVGLYMLVQRDARLLTRLHAGGGVLILLLVAMPWLFAAEARNPGFLHFFFITEHWERFTNPSHQRPGPWWYFIPIGIGFLMPWLPALVLTAKQQSRRSSEPATPGFDPTTFCWCWAASIFVFFSISSSKLPAYILPSLAGIALAASATLAREWRRALLSTAWTLIAGGYIAVAVAIPAARLIKIDSVRHAYQNNVAWVVLGCSLLVVTGLTTLWLLNQGQRTKALVAITLGGILGVQVAMVTAYRIDAHFSSERLIEGMSGGAAVRPFQPDTPFYSVDFFDHTVPFYLGRTVTLVKERGELAWGTDRAPGSYIADMAEFSGRWRSEDQAFAIMRSETFEALSQAGLPMHVFAQDGRRIVVTRR